MQRSGSLWSRGVVVHAAFLALLAAFVLHALRFNFLIDDAYITFRYAHNLAEGHGLCFNPGGDHVEGISNLLWALLLSLGDVFGVEPELLSRVLGFAASLALLVLVRDVTRRILADEPAADLLALVPVAFLALNRSFAAWTTGGLETRLHTLLVFLAAALADRVARRGDRLPLSLAPVLAALILVRVDGFVQVLFLILGWLLWAKGQRSSGRAWLMAGVVLATLIAVSVFRVAYYGDIVPNTVHVKVVGPALASGLAYLGWVVRDYGLFLLVPFTVAAILSRDRSPFLPMALVIAAGQFAYVVAVGADHFEYRLLDPVWPFLAIFLVVGACRAYRWMRSPVPRFAAIAVAASAFAWTGLPAIAGFKDRVLTLSVETESFLCLVWTRMGDWFGSHAAPGEVIAVGAAGVIPYRSGLPAFDMLGLNDRIVARSAPTPGAIIPGHRKMATWEDMLVRGGASYVIDSTDFHKVRPAVETEPPRVIEVAGRRFAMIPYWAKLDDFWIRFMIVSEDAVTDRGIDPSRIKTRIRP
jgi:arabinofuranosyltransferase